MLEISAKYWHTLAQQTVLICSLLCGFSIAFMISLLVYDSKNRFVIYTLKAVTVTACCFLYAVFAWTTILMMTTEGYPFHFDEGKFRLVRLTGGFALLFGIISLTVVISLSGWIKSRSTGIFTTIVGIITFLAILLVPI